MEIKLLTNKKIFASNCYAILSDGTFSVVDPSVSYSEALEIIPELKDMKHGCVLLTHGHLDHLWEIESYCERGFEVFVSSEDAKLLSDPIGNCSYILRGPMNQFNGKVTEALDGEVVSVGGGQSFRVMKTPGHTAGSVTYLGDTVAFTGDTLFARGTYGRCDLVSSDYRMMAKSLESLLKLNEAIIIYPGHGEISTIGETKSYFR